MEDNRGHVSCRAIQRAATVPRNPAMFRVLWLIGHAETRWKTEP